MRNHDHRKLRIPGRRRRRFLWILQLCLTTIASVQYILVGSYAIDVFGNSTRTSQLASLRTLNTLKVAVTCVGCFYLFSSHIMLALLTARGKFFLRHRLFLRLSSHWTTSATKGVFLESLLSVMKGHNLIVAFTLFITMLTTTPNFVSYWLFRDTQLSKEDIRYLESVCGFGPNLCRAGWDCSFFLPWVCSCQFLSILLKICFTPVRFWSPITKEAVSRLPNERVKEFLRLSFPLSIVSLAWTVFTVLASFYWVGTYSASGIFLSTYCVISIGNFVFQACVILLLCGFRSSCNSAIAPVRGSDCVRQQGFDAPTGLFFRLRKLFQPDSTAGKHYWQDIFLSMSILVWAYAELTTGTHISGVVSTWVMRAVLLTLAATYPDAPATFDDLVRDGAGFGLVANATQLRDALDSVARGEPCCRKIRMYKASMLRMRETLAVSYRWQPSSVGIAPGVSLNMSPWQMATLAGAIRTHRITYVWVDALSVPQTTHGALKQRLISRMMAVYASAGVTLAMRSLEPPGQRYHQRGWTLQEFCSASYLLIKQQNDPASVLDFSCRPGSVSSSEDRHMRSLREWCSARFSECRPFWLNNGVAACNLLSMSESYERYLEVSGKVSTKIPSDMLRALYPLLMNTPVEDQEELVQLISQVTSILNVEEPGLAVLSLSFPDMQVQDFQEEVH